MSARRTARGVQMLSGSSTSQVWDGAAKARGSRATYRMRAHLSPRELELLSICLCVNCLLPPGLNLLLRASLSDNLLPLTHTPTAERLAANGNQHSTVDFGESVGRFIFIPRQYTPIGAHYSSRMYPSIRDQRRSRAVLASRPHVGVHIHPSSLL